MNDPDVKKPSDFFNYSVCFKIFECRIFKLKKGTATSRAKNRCPNYWPKSSKFSHSVMHPHISSYYLRTKLARFPWKISLDIPWIVATLNYYLENVRHIVNKFHGKFVIASAKINEFFSLFLTKIS